MALLKSLFITLFYASTCLAVGSIFTLFKTGVDSANKPLAFGSVDPHWTLAGTGCPATGPDLTLGDPSPIPPVPGTGDLFSVNYQAGWTTTRGWLSTTPTAIADTGCYYFVHTFQLAPGDAQKVTIGLNVAASSQAVVFMNDKKILFTNNAAALSTSIIVPRSAYLNGFNKLTVVVSQTAATAAPLGMILGVTTTLMDLYSTGVNEFHTNIPTGNTDLHWTLIGTGCPDGIAPTANTVLGWEPTNPIPPTPLFSTTFQPGWNPVPGDKDVNWISVNTTNWADTGCYWYSHPFVIPPTCINTTALSTNVVGDDNAFIMVNGNTIGKTVDPCCVRPFPVNFGILNVGLNEVRIGIVNLKPSSTGLFMEWFYTAVTNNNNCLGLAPTPSQPVFTYPPAPGNVPYVAPFSNGNPTQTIVEQPAALQNSANSLVLSFLFAFLLVLSL